MKKYFAFLIFSLIFGVFYTVSCSNDSKPNPCGTDPQPGCPDYIDPCDPPIPGCPDYVDPDPVLGSSITIGTSSYAVDESFMEKIDDGMWYMKVKLKNATKPLVVHAVRYTTAMPGYSIETWIANDSITGKESPGSMVNRYEKKGRQVRMAINGGFFDTPGTPISMQAMNSLASYFPQTDFPVIGFDEKNFPYMDFVKMNSRMKIEKNDKEFNITSVNSVRGTNHLVLFNSCKGKRTGTNEWGIEVLCTPEEAQWEQLGNYTDVRCKVMKVATAGNMVIPKGSIVLSGHGTANNSYLNTLRQDDYVTVTVDYFLKSYQEVTSATIRNLISGWNIILSNNEVMEYFTTDALERTNNPRTSVGFTGDKKHVFFVVVEGRDPASAGVTTKELAQVMQYFGAVNAINLDGGGSSCMMIDKELKNVITGGTFQRAVADGIAIIKKSNSF